MFPGSHPSSRDALALVLAAGLLGCGGSITFQNDPEPVPLADGGTVAQPDATVGPQPDGGPACTPGTRPAQPTTWPYPISAASYQSNFASLIPAGAITCDSAACHGNDTNVPYIPSAAMIAADPANATRAINELWLRARPPVSGQPALRRKHAPDGDNYPLAFTPQQVAAIEMFIARAYDCAWKTAPAPGPNECPRPDTSHCDQ